MIAQEPVGHARRRRRTSRPRGGTRAAPRPSRSCVPRRSAGRTGRWRPGRSTSRERDQGDQPRPQACRSARAPASGSARAARRAAAHSPKFQAVTVPTTAANWWLLRVACKLRKLNAAKRRSRNGLIRQPARRARRSGRAASALPRFALARCRAAAAVLRRVAGCRLVVRTAPALARAVEPRRARRWGPGSSGRPGPSSPGGAAAAGSPTRPSG